MAVISNQCANCGQWRGKNHQCPMKGSFGEFREDYLSIPSPKEIDSSITARVDRGRAYIAEIQKEREFTVLSADRSQPRTHSILDFGDLAIITALSRDCDLNPDTPWRPGERDRMRTAYSEPHPSITRTNIPLPTGEMMSYDEATEYILQEADKDPVLRDRLRLAAAKLLDNPAERPSWRVEGGLLITTLHHAARTDSQYAEGRDWAVAYEAGHAGTIIGTDSSSTIEDIFSTMHDRAEQQGNEPVSLAITRYYYSPNAG